MFVTEHLVGRIQCVDEDFVCIDLHLSSSVDAIRPFIDQIFLNKYTGDWKMPIFETYYKGNYHFDNISLKDEMQSIVNQYFAMCKELKLKNS